MTDSLRPAYDFALSGLDADPGSRGRIFRAVAEGTRVLDAGCDTGRFGEALRQLKRCEVHGLERAEGPAAEARQRLDRVYTRSIEAPDAFADLSAFDAVLFLDVLEHLYDPWAILARGLTALRPGGSVFAVVPNVAHISVVRRLWQGRFDYEQHGTMDRTHIRWFTRHSLGQAFVEAGFEDVQVDVVPVVPRLQQVTRIGQMVADQLARWLPDQLGGSLIGRGRRPVREMNGG